MKFYVKPQNTYHLGIDHLEIFAHFYDEDIFKGIDFDNSHYGTLGIFTFTKHEVPKYQYKISFSKDDYPMFAFYKGKLSGSITTKDYVCFYSTVFRTHTIEEMTGILYTYFKFGLSNINKAPRYRNSPLKRFDICIDLLVPIEKLSRFFHPLSQRGATFRGEGGSLETQYIGEKKKSRNKRHIIRIYDKKKDIIAKGKDSLYHDYLLHQDITRIELEVRRELAQTYTFEELVVPENLFGLLKNYLKRHTHIFDLLDVTELSLYRKPEIIPFRLIQANEEGRKRVTMYLGHARGLLERGLCPLYTLLVKDIIHIETKALLSELGDFSTIIYEIQKEHELWREIVSGVTNKNYDTDTRK